MSSTQKGIWLTIISAVIFGFTPAMMRVTFDEGGNAISMTFMRAAMAMPVLAAIMKVKKIPFAVNRKEAKDVLIGGGSSNALTAILLCASYAYIPVGMSTTLHFVYPIAVSLSCVLFFKEKLNVATVIALIAATVGVFLSAGDLSGGSLWGSTLALASGFTFAFYIVYTDKSSIRQVHYIKVAFYTVTVSTLLSGAYGLSTGVLTFSLSLRAWVFIWIVSMLGSVVAIPCLQLGIRLTGATMASILSTFEPITSVICDALFMDEPLSPAKAVGCGCIVVSVILIALKGRGETGISATATSGEARPSCSCPKD